MADGDDPVLVWTTDIGGAIQHLLLKCDGDVEKAVCRLFHGSCSYTQAREYSVVAAPHLGLTDTEFMAIYRKWRAGHF